MVNKAGEEKNRVTGRNAEGIERGLLGIESSKVRADSRGECMTLLSYPIDAGKGKAERREVCAGRLGVSLPFSTAETQRTPERTRSTIKCKEGYFFGGRRFLRTAASCSARRFVLARDSSCR